MLIDWLMCAMIDFKQKVLSKNTKNEMLLKTKYFMEK